MPMVLAAMMGGDPGSHKGGADSDMGHHKDQRDQAEDGDEDEGDRGDRNRGRKRKKDRRDGGEEEEEPKKENTLAEYLNKRTFLFVHHYSGAEKDVLSEAIKEEAVRQNVKVKTVSVDREEGSGHLAEDEPYNS